VSGKSAYNGNGPPGASHVNGNGAGARPEGQAHWWTLV
jgi:hypothetical protein